MTALVELWCALCGQRITLGQPCLWQGRQPYHVECWIKRQPPPVTA